jgi:hypothetical protein
MYDTLPSSYFPKQSPFVLIPLTQKYFVFLRWGLTVLSRLVSNSLVQVDAPAASAWVAETITTDHCTWLFLRTTLIINYSSKCIWV